MPTAPAINRPKNKISKIAAQIERLEAHSEEWARDPVNLVPSPPPPDNIQDPAEVPESPENGDVLLFSEDASSLWENEADHAMLEFWGETLRRLVLDMKEQSKQPFSTRTRQISALCAFVPFVFSILAAAIQHLPNMPSLSFWSKITWFITFPMFLAMTGAFVGFLIGVMLDSLEAQNRLRGVYREEEEEAPVGVASAGIAPGLKTGVWVSIEDLEPNQRVAETVVGENGTPILLRHTLLKPVHLEMLRKQEIKKVKVEAMKYPGDGDLALAG
jgi:hypothetical protein